MNKSATIKAALLLWSAILLVWYVGAVLPLLVPEIVKWGLPFMGAANFPNVKLVFSHVFVLVSGLIVLPAAGFAAGGRLADWLRLKPLFFSARVACGWLVLGLLMLGLGLVGCWFPWLLVAILLCFAAVGLIALPKILRSAKSPLPFPLGIGFVFPAALVGWTLALMLMAPEIFQDPLRYHLFFPSQFLVLHKFVFAERFFFWSYMGPVHMLNAAALSTGGMIWAKALNFTFAVLGILVVLRIVERLGFDPVSRKLAVGLTATAPGYVFITGSAFIEHSLVLFILLAADSILDRDILFSEKLRRAAFYLGAAFSIKYTAVFGAAGIAAMIIFGGELRRWETVGARLKPWLVFLFLSPIIPWASLRWIWTRDPISPILGRYGFDTLDASSKFQLEKAYEFAKMSYLKWAENIGSLLAHPVSMSGVKGGFWESAGLAVVCLFPMLILGFKSSSRDRKMLVYFLAGSLFAWLFVFGGMSPHYVAGYSCVWIAALLGLTGGIGGLTLTILRNMLVFCIFFQAIAALIVETTGFYPRDVAMGIISRDSYLEIAVVSKRVNYPIRKALENHFPRRGRVYVFGDDNSFYLGGRVHLDYDFASDPLIWRLAAESRNPADLRRKIRQRGWTHFLYSIYWSDFYGKEASLRFIHDRRTLWVMQEFWRRYANPLLVRELMEKESVKSAAYVFGFMDEPRKGAFRADFAKKAPFLPGAEALIWEGDQLLAEGNVEEAKALYLGWISRVGDCALLCDRMARTAAMTGDMNQLRRWLGRERAQGWETRELEERLK